MKALKWLLILVIAVPLLVFAALAAFLSFADLGQYKDLIEEQAEVATGRALKIDGDIKVSLFPWIKLETGAIELANAEGFGEQPMVSLSSASAGIKLMPLFSGNIELDVVSVEGLKADLQVNAAGVSNLDDLSGDAAASESAEPSAATGDTSLPALTLGGLALHNAELRYRDATSGTDAHVTDINLDIGTLDGKSDTPIKGKLHVLLQPDDLRAQLNLDTKLRANLQEMRFNALALELKAALTGPAIPTGAIDIGVGGDIEADLVAQTLNIPKLKFLLGDTTFAGDAQISGLDQAMPTVRFKLAGDTLNVDKLLGVTAAEPVDEAAPAATTEVATDDSIELPTETLRALDVAGQMTLENLIVSNVEMTAITLELQAKDGLLAIPKLAATLYEGSIDSNFSLDARKDVPLYSADANISGVQAQPLLAAAADFNQLLGQGNIALNVNTSGESVSQLTEALGGNFSFNFSDGAIDGINLAAEGRKLMSLLGKSSGDEPAESTRKTDFSALGASAKIVDGVIESTDLEMLSPLLRVGGEGTVALPAEMVDYTVKLLLTGTLEGQGGTALDDAKGLRIPLRIKGSFTDLSNDFVGTVRKGMKDALKADLKAQADEKIAAAKAKLDAKKAEVKAQLDAKKAEAQAKLDAERSAKEAELKAKAQEEKALLIDKAEKEKERLKKKASDALKKLF